MKDTPTYEGGRALVLGASGFLGSHVVRALVAAGRQVRVLARASSNLSMTDDLDIERRRGDVFDRETVRDAMQGCTTVFYCIVDARSWLRDSGPLWQTNVVRSRIVMEEALAAGIERFVFTSSIVTIGLNPSGVATEEDAFNWGDQAPPYVLTRVAAENQLFDLCRQGLPGIACNVATTFGGRDHVPTPHGQLLRLTVARRMPVYWDTQMSVVGIECAADALLRAEAHGRVAERYIITNRMMSIREATEKTAAFAGVRPPRLELPYAALRAATYVTEKVLHAMDRDSELSMSSLLLSSIMGEFEHGKATRELGWNPAPMEDALRDAATWFAQHP